jgi:hypothetical protein
MALGLLTAPRAAYAQAAGERDGTSERSLLIDTHAALREVPPASAVAMRAGDSVGNGVRNGALIGFAAGAGFGVFLSQALCEVPDCGDQLRRDLPSILLIGALGAGIGAAAGWGVDAAMDRRTVVVAPVVSRRGGGATAVIRWR